MDQQQQVGRPVCSGQPTMPVIGLGSSTGIANEANSSVAVVSDVQSAAPAIQPAQPGIALIEEPAPLNLCGILRLDPAVHLIPDVFRIILQYFDDDLTKLLRLRSVSPKWAFEVEELLQSKHSLMLFSNPISVGSYLDRLTRNGLRDDDFYKLSKEIKDKDELIRCRVTKPNRSPESVGIHLPIIMPNVNKLIIIDNGELNQHFQDILGGHWASSLTSLVIFTSFKSSKDLKRAMTNFSKALAKMTNLTRLEMYDDWNLQFRASDLVDMKNPQVVEVLGRLEHFVGENERKPKVRFVAEMKKRLAAFTPGTLKHLGAFGVKENSFADLFQNWEQGKILATSLKRLQLGQATQKMLLVVAEQFKGLQYLSFGHQTRNVTLLTVFKILAGLNELEHLKITYPARRGFRETVPSPLPILPSVRRLDIYLCDQSFLDTRFFYLDFPSIILATFPGLQELNLSDARNLTNRDYGRFEDKFVAIPQKRFSWRSDCRDYFPERIWSLLPPGQCRDEGCENLIIHKTDWERCSVVVAQRRIEMEAERLRDIARNEARKRKAAEEEEERNKKLKEESEVVDFKLPNSSNENQ